MSTVVSRARVYRIPAVVALAGLVVGGVLLDRSDEPAERARRPVARVIDGPSVPSPDAVSVAWYCAEGTSTADGRATETVIIGNLSTEAISATITVMPGGDQAPQSRTISVGALAQERIAVASILATAEPGVVVEVLGGPAVVEHELVGRDDIAVGPCARGPSRDWYFAGGTTTRGAEEWLSLFNPYGDDAIVDVSFLTEAGFQAPGSTQDFVVPRRSRVSLAVHDQVRRQELVAISVHARVGRVVAERTLRFDGTDARRGMAVSLGVTASATRWRVPSGDGQSGAAESLAIANFGVVATEAEVAILLDGQSVLEPELVDVPARGVVRVDLAQRIPADTGYAVEVRATGRAPVVVEVDGTWASPAPVTAVASTSASATTARRWVFAVGALDEEGDAVISVLNVAARPLTVELYAYTAGDPGSPHSAPAAAVPPGERTYFVLSEHGIRPGQVLAVVADGPIVASREIIARAASEQAGSVRGVSLAPGIPDLGGRA